MTTDPIRCIEPGTVSPDDLVAFAHGEAPPVVWRHVDRCPSCQAVAGDYGRMARVLRAGLFRRSCPESIVLGEYAMGILPPTEAQQVAAHILECPHCGTETDSFRAFLATPDLDPAASPIAAVTAAATAVTGTLRRLFAVPSAPPTSAFAGLRGGGGTASMTYSADGLHLTVSIQRSSRGAPGSVVIGLLEPGIEDYAGIVAELYAGDQLLQRQEVDDLGNFLFNSVSAGTYRIEVTVPAAIVVIDPLEIP